MLNFPISFKDDTWKVFHMAAPTKSYLTHPSSDIYGETGLLLAGYREENVFVT